MKRTFSAALATCVLLTACGDLSTSVSAASVAGVYDLISVDGVTLPAAVTLAGPVTFVSGTWTLNSNDTYLFDLRLLDRALRGSGTFTAGGKIGSAITINFVSNTDFPFSGNLSGNRLTIERWGDFETTLVVER